MDPEPAKDAVEEVTAATAEALASLIPVFGDHAAIAVSRAFGSAVQRRNDRLLAQIAADLMRLDERVGIIDPEGFEPSKRRLMSFCDSRRLSNWSYDIGLQAGYW